MNTKKTRWSGVYYLIICSVVTSECKRTRILELGVTCWGQSTLIAQSACRPSRADLRDILQGYLEVGRGLMGRSYR